MLSFTNLFLIGVSMLYIYNSLQNLWHHILLFHILKLEIPFHLDNVLINEHPKIRRGIIHKLHWQTMGRGSPKCLRYYFILINKPGALCSFEGTKCLLSQHLSSLSRVTPGTQNMVQNMITCDIMWPEMFLIVK